MQKLITKYGLAAHLAFVAVAPLFFSPTTVLWLSVLAAVWLVMEPSRIGHERLYGARRRVIRSVLSDPLFWVSLSLVVIALMRFLNTGIGLAYDAEVGKWFVSAAAFPLLPASVGGSDHSLVACAVASLVVLQGCRHGLGRAARGAFALVASSITGIGAIVWSMLVNEGLPGAVKAVTLQFNNPSFQGCVYGIYLVMAIVSLAMAFERRWLRVMPVAIVGIAGNLLGLFLFSPAAVGAAFVGASLVVFLYAFVFLRLRVHKTAESKLVVFLGLAVGIAVLVAMSCLPQEMVNQRIEPFVTGTFAPEGYLTVRKALSEISLRVWKESPWLGSGLGSYALDLQFHATPEEWKVIPPIQKTVSNGYWLLLVERGVIGAFCLAVPLLLLLGSYLIRLARGIVVRMPDPLAWTGLVLLIVAALEMLVDVSFLSPAAILSLAAVLALSANAFPKEQKTNV